MRCGSRCTGRCTIGRRRVSILAFHVGIPVAPIFVAAAAATAVIVVIIITTVDSILVFCLAVREIQGPLVPDLLVCDGGRLVVLGFLRIGCILICNHDLC